MKNHGKFQIEIFTNGAWNDLSSLVYENVNQKEKTREQIERMKMHWEYNYFYAHKAMPQLRIVDL